jgi:hypothetical protein
MTGGGGGGLPTQPANKRMARPVSQDETRLIVCQMRRGQRQFGNGFLGRIFKMFGDEVFEEKAGWRGVTKENTLSMGLRLRNSEARRAFPQKSSGRRAFVPGASLSRPS